MALDRLELYGHSFQTKIISSLLLDKKFLGDIFDILDPNFFESESNAELVKIISKYFDTYNDVPTLQVFKTEMAGITNTFLRTTMQESLKDVVNEYGATDLQYVKDEFLDFCRNQKIKGAILQSVDLLRDGEYDAIKTLVDDAMQSGISRDIGTIYKELEAIENRLIHDPRKNVVPTEWDVFNDIMDGGLGAGDLGILVGTAGASKSWFLVSLGYHALLLGKNVVHFTLELNENYTGMRYDAKLTSIVPANLKYNIDRVKDSIDSKIKGNLIIKYYPTKTASVATFKSELNKMKGFGHEIDMVIVDYADIMRSDNIKDQKGGSYFEAGGIYEDLRGLAGEYNVPVWTASQAQRSANNQDIVTGDQVAESYKKVMTGDFVASVSRKVTDKLTNTARYHVIKNRYGVDGLTFPATIDASIGKIHVFAPSSVDGKKTTDDMKDADRKLISKKLKDFERDTNET